MHLRKNFPEAHCLVTPSTLKWEGITGVREASMRYHLRLDHKIGERPRVRVLAPNLIEIADGKSVPHLFSQAEQTLCLHWRGSWQQHQILAETIVPWSVLWTEYFEWWLVTGRWAGDEIAHEGPK
jgi:hypothetical protein